MAMLAFSHFEKSKNQFQLIRHLIHDMTLGPSCLPADQHLRMSCSQINVPIFANVFFEQMPL